MALIARSLLLKHFINKVFKMSTSNCKISTSSSLYENAIEELKNNPFYEKYAAKIVTMQLESPEEFKDKIKENEDRKRRKQKVEKNESKERPYSTASQFGKPSLQFSPFTKQKSLDAVMKTELLKDKTADEIKQIWLDYHRNKDAVVGIVSKETYSLMHERGKEFSTFLLPLPRSQGYEFIMCQFIAHEVHFTPLIAFQTHKENAPECLTLTFYPDLQEEKGIVLMKGEFNTDILNCQEAQCLINELQLYYAQNNEKRLDTLRRFTYKPNDFNHMDLIEEVECLSL